MGRGKGIGGHQNPNRGDTDVWLTPPEMVEALGPFGLDPCCPSEMPWRTASVMVSLPTDGLSLDWSCYGLTFMNPPYGPETGRWLEKMAGHGNGIALVFARTETKMFHEWAWRRASSMLFLEGRIHFHRPDGTRAPFNAGAPSVLVGYGEEATMRLGFSGLAGKMVNLK